MKRIIVASAGLAALGFVGAALHAQMTTGPAVSKPYGLCLPRDRDKLVLPDDAYPRFPLMPGQEAYKDVDGPKIKSLVKEITAISDRSRDAGCRPYPCAICPRTPSRNQRRGAAAAR